jgi:hypothetical protein
LIEWDESRETQAERAILDNLFGQIGAGRGIEELLADYPYLEREDILQALRYGAWRMEEREIDLAGMKLIVEMNLSPRWIPLLGRSQIEAVHWSSVG